MAARFDSKVALVTGAGSGIGRAVALRLAEEGAAVFGVDVDEGRLQETKRLATGMVSLHQADLAEPSACSAAVRACVEELGRLDVLGNVAGIYVAGHVEDMSLEQYRRVMAVNLDAYFFLAQAAIPHLLETGGNIVNVASNAALQGVPYSVAYCMSKGGVLQLTRSLAVEFLKRPLRVNAIAPAGTNTNIAASTQFPADADVDLLTRMAGLRGMAEPEEIVSEIENFFRTAGQLKNKKALVTAGPTYEQIDPVRFIGNHSSGKMGYALAEELANRGAMVTLVSGPVSIETKHKNIKLVKVQTAEEMYNACSNGVRDYDVAIMAAAVADYTPVETANEKIKKTNKEITVTLRETKDILASLGKEKSSKQFLVGFALETANEQANAQKKLREKNTDLIVLNSLKDEGAGFGHDTNKVTLFFKNGEEKKLQLKSKTELAKDIVDSIITLLP